MRERRKHKAKEGRDKVERKSERELSKLKLLPVNMYYSYAMCAPNRFCNICIYWHLWLHTLFLSNGWFHPLSLWTSLWSLRCCVYEYLGKADFIWLVWPISRHTHTHTDPLESSEFQLKVNLAYPQRDFLLAQWWWNYIERMLFI